MSGRLDISKACNDIEHPHCDRAASLCACPCHTTELFSPEFFARELVRLEGDTRVLMMKHNVPLGVFDPNGLRSRGDFLRKRYLAKFPEQCKWLDRFTWWGEICAAAERHSLPYFAGMPTTADN